MKITVPNLRELIREKVGGRLGDISRDAFRKAAIEAIDEINDLEEKVAMGAFICDVCDNVHYNWAPKACRDAYNSEYW